MKTSRLAWLLSSCVMGCCVMGCDDGDSKKQEPEQELTGDCTDGKSACVGDKIQYCKDGAWADAESCGDNKVCEKKSDDKAECVEKKPEPKPETGDCTKGKSVCSGEKIQYCKDGKWADAESCGDNKVCEKKSDDKAECVEKVEEQAECQSTESKCADGVNYQTCKNGKWSTPKSCGENKECKPNGNKAACKSIVVEEHCVDGTQMCDEYKVVTCKSGKWDKAGAYECPDSCENDDITHTANCYYSDNALYSSACISGNSICHDKKIIHCVEQRWDIFDSKEENFCEYGCVYDESIKSAKCLDGKLPACVDGVTQCSGDELFECADGHWNRKEGCKYGCAMTSEGAVCNTTLAAPDDERCMDGVKSCVGKSVVTCRSGEWDVNHATECELGCINNYNVAWCATEESLKTRCNAGTSKCDGNNIVYCGGTVWNTDNTKKCDYGCTEANGIATCKVKEEEPECSDGETDCLNGGVIQCVKGKWNTANVKKCNEWCESGATLYTGRYGKCVSAPKVCAAGQSKCKNNEIVTCENGQWSSKTTKCSQGCIENSGVASCKSDECTSGDRKCASNGEDLMRCEAGKWNKLKSCDYDCEDAKNGKAYCLDSDGEEVVDNTPDPDCYTGQTICNEKKRVSCKNGKWDVENATECAYGCYFDGKNGVCHNDPVENGKPCEVEGESKCTEDKAHKLVCLSGTWGSIACDNGCSQVEDPCTGNNCTGKALLRGECNPEQSEEKCVRDECAMGGFLRKCVNGKYQDQFCDLGCVYSWEMVFGSSPKKWSCNTNDEYYKLCLGIGGMQSKNICTDDGYFVNCWQYTIDAVKHNCDDSNSVLYKGPYNCNPNIDGKTFSSSELCSCNPGEVKCEEVKNGENFSSTYYECKATGPDKIGRWSTVESTCADDNVCSYPKGKYNDYSKHACTAK